MAQLSRKEREREEREALIVDTAREIILSDGYFGLSIDRLAAAVEYSKGTIYQHFEAKEDIILAIAAQSMWKRVELFELAATFDGTSRERIQAITIADQLFVRLYPGHFQIEHLIKSRSLWAKTSDARQQQLWRPEGCCGDIVLGIIHDAVTCGDLQLNNREPGEIAFGLWTLALGVHTLANARGLPGSPNLSNVGIEEPYDVLRRNQQAFLDGVDWKPLSSEWDYRASRKKILATIFAEQSKEAENEPHH